MELKYKLREEKRVIRRSNRTFMELKLLLVRNSRKTALSSNRTFMELK